MPDRLEPYLANLRALPFVDDVQVEAPQPSSRVTPDGILRVRAKGVEYRLLVELKTSHLSYPIVDAVLAYTRQEPGVPWVLFAPHVGRPMAAHLKQAGLNFLDLAGNCWITLGTDHTAEVIGRSVERVPQERALRAPAYQALFTLLARPDAINQPIRSLAADAGVSKSAVAGLLNRLEAEGFIGRSGSRRHLLHSKILIDRWVTGYAEVLRPSLLVGLFDGPEPDPSVLEERIEKTLDDRIRWTWSGGPAAFRLTKHFRGDSLTILGDWKTDLNLELRLLPSKSGRVSVLRPVGPLTFESAVPRTAHPLLVYAELLVTPHERSAEAALELRERYLESPL
jgi:hypothetical protein